MEKSKGLGDTIYKITTITGIKWLVHLVMNIRGKKDCGCSRRRDKLNNMITYKKK